MEFLNFKDNKESIELLFWQTSILWQRKIKHTLQQYNLNHIQFVIICVIEKLFKQNIFINQKDISYKLIWQKSNWKYRTKRKNSSSITRIFWFWKT